MNESIVSPPQRESLKSLLQHQSHMANRLDELLIESGGELIPEIEALLKQLEIVEEQALPSKIDAFHFIINKSERMIEYNGDYKEIFARLQRGWKTVNTRLKEYLKFNMIAWGIEELRGDIFRYTLVNGRETLAIDESQLPPEFLMQVVNFVPDKEKITQALLKGEQVPGATLVPGKSLRSGTVKRG